MTLPSSLLHALEPLKPGSLTACSAEVKGDNGQKTNIRYWTWLPEGEKPADGWPLMVFLHGAGERGDNLDAVKRHGPAKLAGKRPELNDFLMIAPQCPQGRWWDIVAVRELIEVVAASRDVDRSRIYITGLSMGGFATWGLLAAHPDLAAAAVPICGGGEPGAAQKFARVPVWAFHGAKDEVVPLARSTEMVDALKAAGADVKFTVYPEAAHDSWTQTYNNPEVYAWLLKHRLPKNTE